jgi:hypothetical protein
MNPPIVIPAVAFVLVGLGTAQSAPRQGSPQGGWNNAPVRLQGPQQGFPTRPSWATQDTCFTDDGYGGSGPAAGGGPELSRPPVARSFPP